MRSNCKIIFGSGSNVSAVTFNQFIVRLDLVYSESSDRHATLVAGPYLWLNIQFLLILFIARTHNFIFSTHLERGCKTWRADVRWWALSLLISKAPAHTHTSNTEGRKRCFNDTESHNLALQLNNVLTFIWKIFASLLPSLFWCIHLRIMQCTYCNHR